MKSKLIVILVLTLSILSVEAKDNTDKNSQKPGSLRLEQHFADPVKDFTWMNEEEKAKYVSFIVNLNLLLEAELSQGSILMISDNFYKESHFKWQNEFLKGLFSVVEAHAVAPVLLLPYAAPVAGTALRFVSPHAYKYVMKQAPQAITTVGGWWQRLTSRSGLAAIGTTGGTAAWVAVDSFSGNEGSPPITDEFSAAAASAAAVEASAASAPASAVVADAPTTAVTATAPTAVVVAAAPAGTDATAAAGAGGGEQSKTTVNNAREEGSFCIFGGYASKYKVVENRAFCPAPSGMINNEFCAAKKINPSFLCQSFGLSKSRTEAVIADNLCIPLRSEKGLADLTVRCTDAFFKFSESAKAIDPKKLSEIQEQVRKGIAALEAERGISDIGLMAYCKDENKLNRSAQKGECKALTELITKYKKDFPTIVAAAGKTAPATGKPAAPAAPSSAPATR